MSTRPCALIAYRAPVHNPRRANRNQIINVSAAVSAQPSGAGQDLGRILEAAVGNKVAVLDLALDVREVEQTWRIRRHGRARALERAEHSGVDRGRHLVER